MLERFSKEAERLKIYQGVFDEATLHCLAVLAGKGYFESLEFPISTGKEADVYRATTKDGGFVAIKIYRVETSAFRTMWRYLLGDPRFHHIKKNRRAIVYAWCQKEFRNLSDASAAGVRVPKPIKFMRNVLIMEFIGEGGQYAPLLKAKPPADPKRLVRTLAGYVARMWQKAGIVHGDLSEFNVLMHGEEPVLIDVGQALSIKHPMAAELLRRDLQNIARLGRRWRVGFDWEKEEKRLVK
jgi:RIO kinase 1